MVLHDLSPPFPGEIRIDSPPRNQRSSPVLRAVFPFKRPERNAWLLAIPVILIAFVIWIWVEPGHRLDPRNWVFPALLLGYSAWRHWKFYQLPPLSLEVDEHEMRLLPRSHWGIDPIPRSSIYGIREERTSIFVLYRRGGVEKAAELERCFFDAAAWQQLPELLSPSPVSAHQG